MDNSRSYFMMIRVLFLEIHNFRRPELNVEGKKGLSSYRKYNGSLTISLGEKRHNFLERKGLNCIGEKHFPKNKSKLPQ
jgi:hypothetical protein